MSDAVISVENLSKRYLIGHQSARRESYTALRDVVAREARNFLRKTVDLFHGKQIIQGDEVEEVWALRDISFEVGQGEVIGIIGRNGAGKSTLLKILSRITKPTEGRVRLRGRVGSLLEVGTGFHPELTGRENIFLNGAILGMTRTEISRKFDEIVAFAEIEKFIDTPVKRYSSGMYVRLAFAVAAHLEPEILIVDEVLAVGDVEFQKKCLGRMDDIASKDGRTVLFVSHNMGSVRTLCKRALFLECGQVAFSGNTTDTIANYLGRDRHESRVKFKPQYDRPSISSVTVDENELEIGNLIIDVEFISPFPLAPPVPGIVVTSNLGVPVFGSNARFHNKNYNPCSVQSGVVRMEARALPLVNGDYRLSVWLGDSLADYDVKRDILSFAFRRAATVATRPPAEVIGHLDWEADWRVLEKCNEDAEPILNSEGLKHCK